MLRRSLGRKQQRLIYAAGSGDQSTANVETPVADRERYCIDDGDVLKLADYAIRIEQHYSRRAGHPVPMDIEWAKDGLDGELYIVQARPETVVSRQLAQAFQTYALKGSAKPVVTGRAIGERIASGPVRVIGSTRDLAAFQTGDVLVAETTSPDWEPVMKRAGAIVTNRGGRTCHAAIVARELGVPAIVGAEEATGKLSTGALVTVSCAEGEIGRVYPGQVPFEATVVDLAKLERPHTADHGQSRQPRPRLPHRHAPQ